MPGPDPGPDPVRRRAAHDHRLWSAAPAQRAGSSTTVDLRSGAGGSRRSRRDRGVTPGPGADMRPATAAEAGIRRRAGGGPRRPVPEPHRLGVRGAAAALHRAGRHRPRPGGVRTPPGPSVGAGRPGPAGLRPVPRGPDRSTATTPGARRSRRAAPDGRPSAPPRAGRPGSRRNTTTSRTRPATGTVPPSARNTTAPALRGPPHSARASRPSSHRNQRGAGPMTGRSCAGSSAGLRTGTDTVPPSQLPHSRPLLGCRRPAVDD